MKGALTLFVISKNEPGASTLTTPYFHHHPAYDLLLTDIMLIAFPDRLSRLNLLPCNIIPDCDEKSSVL